MNELEKRNFMKYSRLKISITNVCNLQCKHCYLNENNYVFLNVNRIKELLRQGKELGVEIIDITGGEPTTHPNFVEIIDYAKKLEFQKINVSTNGIIINQDYKILDALIKGNVECHISLDAINNEKLNLIRGNNVFLKLEESFEILKKNKVNFTIRYSLNKLNYKDVASMIEYGEKLGVNISIGATQLVGHADKKLILNNEEFDEVRKIIKKYKNNVKIQIEECFTEYCPCDGGFIDILSINHFGNSVECLMMSDDKNIVSNKKSLKELWDEALDKKKILKDFKINEKECKECEHFKFCKSGCLVTARTKGCV